MMKIEEAIQHCYEVANGNTHPNECDTCREEHLQIAHWLEDLKRFQESSIENYNTIEVTFKNSRSAIWEADKGEWDDYAYDGSAFCIKKNGVLVGLYSINNVVSVVVK